MSAFALTKQKSLTLVLVLVAALLVSALPPSAQMSQRQAPAVTAQAQIDIAGPAESEAFGSSVTILSNGNIVVADPLFGANDIGAVSLYDGQTGGLITRAVGSTAGDRVGSGGVYALPNGNYIVSSPDWNNGGLAAAGAVTFCGGTAGCSSVSSSGSLLGDRSGDRVSGASSASGFRGITVLSSGDFVVSSPDWSIDSVRTGVGAVTRCSGTSGCVGPISASNSLIGGKSGDGVGSVSAGNSRKNGVTALTNGGYVVSSSNWDIGAVLDVGAVTPCSAAGGCVGMVSMSNSLTGSSTMDIVGEHNGTNGVVVLTNGNYVVNSSNWSRTVVNGGSAATGAVTWCSGAGGCVGTVFSNNSLVGSAPGNSVGGGGITAFPNGNYVVQSPSWDNDAVQNVGAATFCNGAGGCAGTILANSSLIGSNTSDLVGGAVTVLTNGNYVVSSAQWHNGSNAIVGAATFCGGATGCHGPVSGSNSLIGGTANDDVSNRGVTALTNGNYVVSSSNWDNGSVVNAGAVTWCSGTTGCVGFITTSNSLIGSTTSDNVGLRGAAALANGRYVALSPNWNNGAIQGVGAATFCGAANGCTGTVSASNSLIGSRTNDRVGGSATVLTNGNYVIVSTSWDNEVSANELIADAGAVTWCDGTSGCTGAVTAANSLTGSTTGDQVGFALSSDNKALALPNGDYAVGSAFWDNGGITNAGAVTYGNGGGGTVGSITADNSVRGTTTNPDFTFQFALAYDSVNAQLVVGRPRDNIVTLFRPNTTPAPNTRPGNFDFDGDGKTDLASWNPTTHNWLIRNSADNTTRAQLDWGNGSLGDIAVPRDYDGDRKTDLAVWRPSEGNWYIIQSATNSVKLVNWGATGDRPVPADYDGDGKTDVAVFRPSEGNWHIIQSATNTVTVKGWGISSDIPVPGFYDSDAKADIAVYRPSEGNWYIIESLSNNGRLVNWGTGDDRPVPADYDGDGRTDPAVFRPSEGNWYIRYSHGGALAKNWGVQTDKLVPGDYDGDGKTDLAVFRPSEGNWYILQSQTNTVRLMNFTQGIDDAPAPSTFIPQ